MIDNKVHGIIFNWFEKYYLVKYSLIILFLFSQYFLLFVIFGNDPWFFGGYLFSCLIAFPFYTVTFLLLEYDWFKKQPPIGSMTYEQLYQRYKCNPKFVKKKQEYSLLNHLKNDNQYYNNNGKIINDIVIFYFSNTSLFIFVGITLNIWLVAYIALSYYLTKINKKKERRKKVRKVEKAHY